MSQNMTKQTMDKIKFVWHFLSNQKLHIIQANLCKSILQISSIYSSYTENQRYVTVYWVN